jgi:hypothetical protein
MNDTTLPAEKLVPLVNGTVTKYVRPSAVQAIVPRLLGGCDIHIAAPGGSRIEKLYIGLDAEKVASALGLK